MHGFDFTSGGGRVYRSVFVKSSLHIGDKIMVIACSILAACITAMMLFYLFFGDWEDFVACVKFWFTLNIISALRGQYYDDIWAEIKLFLWLAISIGEGVLVYVKFS
ncbi:hypothetical protein [Kingella kingae]|uniref:hypothetical protein n=2 Tax=Kingella kingae TaxID=504 RepID=UPI003D6E587D